PIIPPSIPMIVLGTSVGLSISRMFMSGIVPGLIMGVALMVVWFFVVRKDGYKDIKKYGFIEGMKLLLDSIPALFMPVLIIGGIRMGIFTPTEAGAFACVYAVLVCLFVYRELNLKQLYRALVSSAKSTATVMFIVASASAVGYMITVAKVPGLVVSMFGPLIGHPLLLLIVINLFLFVMGMVMDVTPNILIFAPVLFPVIKAAGINEYAFALIMVLNLCIGLITPPVGIVLYVGSSISKLNVTRVVIGVIPFLIIEIAILFLFIFFPSLILVPLGWLT
ncbi:MAG: TRAP transporter large permease, partial [Clostridia bacterium]|nr:TRAP transporter large permease [Clostridia bacterium]